MKEETYKIISICKIANELSEKHYHYILDLMNGGATDCLIRWTLDKSESESCRQSDWEITEYLVSQGANYGETILIEIDY